MIDWLSVVSIVALAGWLVVAIAAFRAQRVDGRKTLMMVLAWVGIFLVAAVVFSVVSP